MKLTISGVTFSAAMVRSPSFSRSSSSTTTTMRPARISWMASDTATKGIIHCIHSTCDMRSGYATRPRRRVKMVAGRLMPHLARFIPSLPTLDLTGVLDILLVAFVVYEALTVVRGTRAGHILIGILTMVSIYALASWTGLEALRSLLSFIVPYIGLAIIVLFQSEIRRTLARIGRKNWFGLAKGFRAPEALSEIMMAAEIFSRDKIGALIVLERDIGLRTFVESGVPLESRISRDILISIFQPGLPLHDGAVIIQKDRISAAACFLPLTTNPALARQLGTRPPRY